MSNAKLLDRQIEIMRALTNADLIYGTPKITALAENPGLWGMSLPHLRLEAELSMDKRIGKIRRTLPLTFTYMRQEQARIIRRFVRSCPPRSYRRYDDSRDFYDFLLQQWQHSTPNPPYLGDIATVEIALARVKASFDDEGGNAVSVDEPRKIGKGMIRLAPGASLLALNYNLKMLFEAKDGSERPLPQKRDTRLIVAPVGDGNPCIVEISPVLFSIISDDVQFRALRGGHGLGEHAAVLDKLLEAGIVRRSS